MVLSGCSGTRYCGSGAMRVADRTGARVEGAENGSAQSSAQNRRWGRTVHRARWQLIERYAGKSVLDVGCGAGAYVRRLIESGYCSVGLDIALPPDVPRGLVCAGSAEHLPFRDGSFDTVLLINVLEHVEEDVCGLREAHRVCRRNVILSVPKIEDPLLGKYGLTCSPYTDFGHRRHYSEKTFRSLLCESGFRPDWIRAVMPINPLGLVLRMLHLPGRDLGRFVHRLPGVRKIHTALHAVATKT